jgi:hypothetical protein
MKLLNKKLEKIYNDFKLRKKLYDFYLFDQIKNNLN